MWELVKISAKQTNKKYRKQCLAENEFKFVWEYGAFWIESNKEIINFFKSYWKVSSRNINVNN